MRYVAIDRTKQGMVLSRSIYDNKGRILLGRHTVLTEEYIEKLEKRGLPGIYIDDEIAKDIEIRPLISEELRNEGVQAVRECNVDSAMNVAKKIVDQILENPSVKLDLVDLRSYDDYTYRHSVNVAVISSVIGMNLMMNVGMLRELSTAAILHDIGKSQIAPEIINKPGKLTFEEFAEVKKHSQYAYEILKQRLDISSKVRTSILSHHENEDGSGYPNGLKSDQIFTYAKIIHVADVFDALVSKRPYKKPFASSEAVEYLMGACDRLFDRNVVKAFLKSVPIYPKGTTVVLSDGRKGIVIDSTDKILRPKIRLFDGTEMDLSSLTEYRNITLKQEGDLDENVR